MTKNDFASLLAYVDGMRLWIEAASGCLRGQMRFADSVNSFLRDAR